MYINEQYRDLELTQTISHTYIDRDGMERSKSEEVLVEHLVDVYVNDRLTMKLICIPQYLTELVLGRLLTEGIINSISEVTEVFVCEFGKRVKIYISDTEVHTESDYVELTPSCCTGNHILSDYFVKPVALQKVHPISWKKEWIFDLADRFAEGMPIHSKTWATHSCFLSQNGNILFQCEDIGRHNALDKVIGYAMRNNIDLTGCIVYSSGRIPTDMVYKAIRAGIPVFSSKASPTVEAIQLAADYDLTLICAARKDRMKQFT